MTKLFSFNSWVFKIYITNKFLNLQVVLERLYKLSIIQGNIIILVEYIKYGIFY